MTLLRLLRAAPRSTSIAACSEVSFTPSTLNNASSSVEWPGRNFKVEAGGLLIAAAAGPATAAAAAAVAGGLPLLGVVKEEERACASIDAHVQAIFYFSSITHAVHMCTLELGDVVCNSLTQVRRGRTIRQAWQDHPLSRLGQERMNHWVKGARRCKWPATL